MAPRLPRRRNDGRSQRSPPPPRPPEQSRPHRHPAPPPPPMPPARLRPPPTMQPGRPQSDLYDLRTRPPMPPGSLRPDDATLPPPMPPGRPQPASAYSLSDLRTSPPMPQRTTSRRNASSSTADQTALPHLSPVPDVLSPVPPTPRPATPPNPIPGEYLDERPNRAVAERKLLHISQIRAEEDHRPVPQQTVAPPPTGEELVVAAHKLHMSQRSEDTDQAANLVTDKASSPSTPPVFSLTPRRLHFEYFVRVDIGGSFHTYPTLTGPFQSRKDAQKAINSKHAEQSKMMCMKGLSLMEIGIRRALYWHNGLRKNSAEALAFMDNLRPEDELVRALLDKYNEDNNLSGDLVYELIKVVHFDTIHERNGTSNSLFYHLNLVIRTKGADGRSNNLFFAEVACMEGKYEEFVLTFFCRLKPEDNGKCIECDADMKHPSDVEYHRGRAKIIMPGGPEPDEETRAYMEELAAVYDEAELKAQEARVRKEFEELYGRGLSRVEEKYVVPARRQEQGVA